MKGKTKPRFSTRAIHDGERPDPATGAHNTPIYQTATFSFETSEKMADAIAEPLDNFFYSRTGNPTVSALERKLASLEGTEDTVVAASGMAAVAIATFSSVRTGDHIVVGDDLFIISRQFFDKECPDAGIEVSFVDITDLEAVRASVRPETQAIFTESVTNPHTYVADLEALSGIAKQEGARLIVDNTFSSPYLLRPVEHGADLVVHSATKYLSGHGDTVAGVVAGERKALLRAREKLDAFGQCLSPMNAWLVLRGVRTLPLRMCQHSANALKLARFLEAHEKVEWVRYPGLASHPQNALARELLPEGFGGMLSFRIRGGNREMTRFADSLQMCELGVSLGDLFTLVYPQPRRGELIRVSVGCEDAEDIIADFEQALAGL